MEKTPVKIYVNTKIEDGSDQEIIEFYTNGEFYIKEQASYLIYFEEHDYGKVKTIVKIQDEEIYIMRSGAVSMKQRFIEDIDTFTHYETQFGQLNLTTNTDKIIRTANTQRVDGFVVVHYSLQVGENQKHLHTLTIQYKEDMQ
ncbi:DUF1934 domain-containing protein [Metabacillus arenae]|uniref:DUF1934 family protein n=1 Tax=Metabacillus arenae TaxID=2771434 RepID=A0A926NEL2_9BACI|nr:DUF1934 family protein [Metabacillus arenae]MBD1379705.1 DUF1934 family protein [Metabacillus arenae]